MFVGRVLEREGITTQGRTLDELVYMVRDAIELAWNEKGVELELLVPGKAVTSFERKARAKASRRTRAKRPQRVLA